MIPHKLNLYKISKLVAQEGPLIVAFPSIHPLATVWCAKKQSLPKVAAKDAKKQQQSEMVSNKEVKKRKTM